MERQESVGGSRQRLVSDMSSRNEGSFCSALSRSQVIPQEVFKTTRLRWYILFTFCYMGLIQGFIGNCWGPVATVMHEQFGWSYKTSSLLATWTAVFFIPGALAFPPLVAVTNMRTVMLGNAVLMALTGILKILSVTVVPLSQLVYLAHMTQILNGLCGAVPFSGLMYITVNWFPPAEQILASGAVLSCLNLGVAVPFLLGSSLLPDATNSTGHVNLFGHVTLGHVTLGENDDEEFYRHRLRWYNIIQGGCLILVLCFTLLYFPSKPKYAPAPSAVTVRLSLKQGVLILLRRGSFWLVVLAFSLTTGVFNGYGMVMDAILQKSNISQSTAGYIGFAALLSSVLANFLIGGLGSVFPTRKKLFVVGFLSLGTACMAVFVAQIENWLPRSMALIWAMVVVGVMCLTGSAPLLFDQSAEASLSVSEELSSTVMVMGIQTTSMIFTGLIQLINDDQKDKLNYVLVGSFALAALCAALYRPNAARQRINALSILVEDLDFRSIPQIEHAGVTVDLDFHSFQR